MERGATKTTEDRIEPKFHFEAGIVSDKKELKDKHLLLVDDQISSGKTFEFLKERYSRSCYENGVVKFILKNEKLYQ